MQRIPEHVADDTIFRQSWWLDAVAPGRWREVNVVGDGRVIARMPYVDSRRYGIAVSANPPLTPYLGPWIEALPGKYETSLARQMELVTELLQALPTFAWFSQSLHPDVTNGLPFHWAGYELSVLYTYRLDALTAKETLWSAMREKRRTEVRKAARQVHVTSEEDVDLLYHLCVKTYERQGLTVPYGLDLLRRIDEASASRGARQLLVARDASGTPHAATYVVSDPRAAYYLIGAADPLLRASGASSLLLWEAIERSASAGSAFDFEGSMVPSIEQFFRSFGGHQVPYLLARRSSAVGRMAFAARSGSRAAVRRALTVLRSRPTLKILPRRRTS